MLLAVAMAVCLGVGAVSTAWAAYSNASVTFGGVKTDDTVRVYQLVGYDDTYNAYTFNQHFGAYIKAQEDYDSSQSPEEWLNSHGSNISGIISDFMEDCRTEGVADNNYSSKKAGSDGRVAFDLAPGYYLVYAETTSANYTIYRPVTVFVKPVGGNKLSVSVNNVELSSGEIVEMKSTTGPSLSKRVKVSGTDQGNIKWGSTATTQVGDQEKFYLTITLPCYAEDSRDWETLDLQVVDTMNNLKLLSKDLGTTPGVRVLFKGETDDPSQSQPCPEVVDAVNYSYNEETNSGVLTLNLNEQKLHEKGMFSEAYNELVIVYDAVATEGVAATGSASNSAVLKYSANSSDKTTPSATTSLFSYSLAVSKVDMASGNSLKGASFSLYRNSTDQPIAFVKEETGSGVYYRLATEDEKANPAVTKVTELAAADGDDSNAFTIRGVEAGRYVLKEVVTPDSYYKPRGDFEVNLVAGVNGENFISSAGNGSSVGAAFAEDKPKITGKLLDSGIYSVTVKNSQLPSLPTTGGAGLIVLTVAGVVLMVAGGAYFALRRKSQR